MNGTLLNSTIARVRIVIRGAVQGVGFRPFIYRLGTGLDLAGWVGNTAQGIQIEAEGEKNRLERFLVKIESDKPSRAVIQSLETSWLDAGGYERFEIRDSDVSGDKSAIVLPDIATCRECVEEIFDPTSRRYLYPFTNCTHCGPRYSIVESLPYDRNNTTMKKFAMCKICLFEYENPANRRFHAQPNACAACGPQLTLWNEAGDVLALKSEALDRTVEFVCKGKIVAIKSLGGFQLICDARNDAATLRLRQKKRREEKPFAVMYPDLETVRQDCFVSELEERLLRSPEAPIVLLRRRKPDLAPSVAPDNPYLGVMLPYTPLHHLLLKRFKAPMIATSGNLAGEPICIHEHEALERLRKIADLFLVHNRPIARPVDDSIVRVMAERELVLRRARGFAPLPVPAQKIRSGVLAVGAHLKNAIAISNPGGVFISQHIGDLETAQAYETFKKTIAEFGELYDSKPERIACDLHPDYLSTQYARRTQLPVISVQHHHAHILACMTENELDGPVLGIAWDGSGYGPDGTVWGGEFLRILPNLTFERAAHFRTFRLPGGETAVREPRRTALAVLYEIFGSDVINMKQYHPVRAFSVPELSVLRMMLAKGIQSPRTSSAGRLFDAVASLAGLHQVIRFEGQAAMRLEFAAYDFRTDESYPLLMTEGDPSIIDWEPLVRALLEDLRKNESAGLISAKFHNTLAEAACRVAERVGEEKVMLSGGCFQNKYLTERTIEILKKRGFRPYWHQRIPPNDGGIALGQTVAALRAEG